MMRIALLALVVLPSSALADDEGSEHTAEVVGLWTDTLGVNTTFDAKSGWSMTVRATPGATEKTYKVAVPAHHNHYQVYVAPGRKAIAWIETLTNRKTITAKDPVIWLYSHDGELLKTWMYSDVLTAKEIAGVSRSISHATWFGAEGVATKAGYVFTVHGTMRKLTLDTAKRTVR